MRLDLLIIFDPHQLEPIFVSYDGKPREGGETPQLMHSLEFRFKFPDRKSEALLGFIKILSAGCSLSDRASCRGMAHSTDLRERIINAVIHKRYTLQKAADTFRRWSRHRQPLPPPATAKQEISPPEPPQVAPAPSMSTRPGLSRASSATTSPTTSAATCCSTKLASASAEPPGAAGYRDWDRREKKTIYASEQGPEARWRYLAWIQQIDPHRSVFVDESGFNLAMTPALRLRPRGQRAVGRVPKSRGEKTSLVAAIGLDEGVSDAMTSTGAVAGVAFLAYLEHPLAPRPRPGQIVVLDRLGGAPQTGGAGGDRSAGVRVGAVIP